MSEGRIKIEASFSKQFFPKYDGEINDGDFAIISWKVDSVLEGAPQLHPFFKTLTTKGNVCEIDRSETYTIIAKENPSEYGMQYDLVYIGQPADFSTIAAQKIFLSRILTDKQVDALFNTLDRPIEYIDRGDIETLSTVKGIQEFTAKKIIEKYEEAKDYSYIYVELEGYGISNKMIQKLVKTYGSPTIAVTKVKENPYILATEVDGIGFRRADEIALESGLAWDSIERVCGFIQYYLVEKAESGNSYVFANELMYGIEDELGGVDSSIIGDAMKQLTNEEDGKVGLLDIEGEPYKRVFMKKYYNLEQRVANELVRLLNGENLFEFGDWRPKVAEIEEAQGWKHTEKQYEGIQMALENQVCVVTGLAGAGKTTVVTAMLEALDAKSGKYSFSQTALSGRASAKLQEVTGEEGMTIHRLLGYNPQEGFTFNRYNQLPYDLIILDEISLVGGEIFLRLIEAIKTGSKLIIIGDDGQLESIGCMNLAKDLIESGIIPTVKLLEPHRQAKKSGIISESHKIRNHIQIVDKDFKGVEIKGELQDFELNIIENLDETRPTMVEYFKEWFPKVGDIMDIHLLVPIKERGDCSVLKLNDDIQAIYNPPTRTKNEIEVVTNKRDGKFYTLREKDKVMIMKNNYKTLSTSGKLAPVFNGWIGIIEEIDDSVKQCVKVHFPIINDTVIIPFSEVESITLGYSSTVHKCLAGDTLVITQNGVKRISELDNGASYNTAKPIADDLKVYNGQYLEAPSHFINSGMQDCLEITTKRNYKISCTLDHGLDVMTPEGKIERKNAEDITMDEYLVLRKGSHIYGSKVELDAKHIVNVDELNVRSVVFKQPTHLTEDLARFLGYVVGDGTVAKSGLKLAKRYREVVEDFQGLVSRIFGYDNGKIVQTKHSRALLLEINSIFIREFCSTFPELLPHQKRIPECILSAPKNIQIAFLSAFMEDGTVNNKRGIFQHIEVSAKNKELIDELRMMLLNMGVVTSYISKKMKSKNMISTAHILHIYKKDAKVLYDLGFRFPSQFKQERLELVNEETISSQTLYPHVGGIIKDIMDGLPANQANWQHARSSYMRSVQKNRISALTLSNFLEEPIIKDIKDENKNQKIKWLGSLYENVEILPIKSIEPTHLQTYCLTMPETNQFVQNGFSGWNCQGSSSKVIIGGIDYSTPPFMRTRELVYTLVTRAEKYCVLVTQNPALRESIETSGVTGKATFLKELLDKAAKEMSKIKK